MMIIQLTQNKEMLIDDEDWHLLKDYRCQYHHTGYAVTTRNKKQYRVHRLILGINDNNWVDHINHNKLDNRKSNLRICTNQQNQFNRLKKNNASSKYKGVSKRKNNWEAGIKFKGKTYYLGKYKTEEDAAKAYDKKALELFGEYSKRNFND